MGRARFEANAGGGGARCRFLAFVQWWVEVTALGEPGPGEAHAVESAGPYEALAAVRQRRQESGPVSLERLGAAPSPTPRPEERNSEDGIALRAIDGARAVRYVVVPGVRTAEVLPPAAFGEALAQWLGTTRGEEPPPSYEVVVSRDHDPTVKLPLSYRERGVRVASTASLALARRLLRHLLDEQRRALAPRPRGQVIELAVFVGPARATALPPPLLSLSYRDWWGAAQVRLGGAPGREERWPVAPLPLTSE